MGQSNAEKDCYKYIQRIALLQDPVCIFPGCNAPAEVGHHLFKRDNLNTAFHPEAVRGVCNFHHTQAHAKPAWFRDIMIGLIDGRYFELQRLANTVVPLMDYRAKRAELKGIVAKLERRAA